MTRGVLLHKTPEEDELHRKRSELSGLQAELAEQELNLAELHAEVAVFEQRYLRTVGVRYAELDEVEAEIAERLARNQPADKGAQKTAQEARERANESGEEARRQANQETKQFTGSPTLKALYREVAKRIHPDLANDPADRTRRQKLMAEANRAYEEGDELRLKAILEEYESSPESVQGQGTAAELVRVIRKIAQINRRLTEIKTEVQQIMLSEIFQLKTKVDDALKHGRDLLREMAADAEARIAEARRRAERLT